MRDMLIKKTSEEGRPWSIKKFAEERRTCRHPEHDPPSLISLSPGTYEHTCPRCREKCSFRVAGVYL